MNTASTKSKTLRVAVEGRNLEDLLPLLEQFPCTIVTEAPELVITHGGDGSLLGAERKYPGIPKCPIRDRKRNPKCPRHDEMTTLRHLFDGTLKVSHLTKLQVTTQAGESLTAINDIMLDRVNPTAAIRYRIWVNGELMRPRVVADSLLFSTPFGSTGYFLSITRGTFSTGLMFSNETDRTVPPVSLPCTTISSELPLEIMSTSLPAAASISFIAQSLSHSLMRSLSTFLNMLVPSANAARTASAGTRSGICSQFMSTAFEGLPQTV